MTTTSLSEIPFPEKSVIVFDLDDTLSPERDFVFSGYRAIEAELGEPVFDRLTELFLAGEKDAIGIVLHETGSTVTKERLIKVYRTHLPKLELKSEIRDTLKQFRSMAHPLGLITDGRSETQRNKIEALGLEKFFKEIVISEEFGSEKPNEANFRHFETTFPNATGYTYIGDNLRKDFIAPNSLGWNSICLLDQGSNIHPQVFETANETQLPKYIVESLKLD